MGTVDASVPQAVFWPSLVMPATAKSTMPATAKGTMPARMPKDRDGHQQLDPGEALVIAPD